MKFFWKYIKENARDVKYLMIIRFCLSLASKSASASGNIRLKRKLGDDRYFCASNGRNGNLGELSVGQA